MSIIVFAAVSTSVAITREIKLRLLRQSAAGNRHTVPVLVAYVDAIAFSWYTIAAPSARRGVTYTVYSACKCLRIAATNWHLKSWGVVTKRNDGNGDDAGACNAVRCWLLLPVDCCQTVDLAEVLH
ncbi:unnamed protein product [Ceratitis capitata]|uniref:(Mediterranean fruit fly) hypothetical protein n=1 Tax=Ceratitis capitata TaxID=7213 RepID=A0A811V598_CERCA|nr:unnamed protein product [Ceratitis capitata]